MARPIWEGSISFGLVQVPVTLYPAEARTELQFHLLDNRDKSRIRFRRVSEATGQEVPNERIVRAFELDNGEYVVMTDKDFELADVKATQTVDIEAFVDNGSIEFMYFDTPYYLLPGKKGERGYVLLRETLRASNKTGIARVVIKSRQHLAALVPKGKGLLLNLLRYASDLRDLDELKTPEGGLAEHRITEREIEMAGTLVQMMSTAWKPEAYHDAYRETLLAFIRQKAEKGSQVQPPAPEPAKTPAVVDFMELLKKSVAEREKARQDALQSRKTAKAPKRGKAKAEAT